MVVNKRRKSSRYRGSWTHGWGEKRRHRGAGHRGGKGMAGTGKRADQKKPCIWKDPKYFGKFGFKKKNILEEIKPINIRDLEIKLKILLEQKLAGEEKGVYTIDVTKLGYNKVLGSGKLTKKFRIISKYFSKGAIEKINEAGGEAVELNLKKEKVEE